jgi:hypothetical protein
MSHALGCNQSSNIGADIGAVDSKRSREEMAVPPIKARASPTEAFVNIDLKDIHRSTSLNKRFRERA